MSQPSIKRILLRVIVPYSLTWLLLAALSVPAQRFLGDHISLWLITAIVIAGACADWFGEWLKAQMAARN